MKGIEMHTIDQLEKQQVGLRLPKYLVAEIDEFTEQFNVNRTDIIMEAIKSYVSEQKAKVLYASFGDSCKELKDLVSGNEDADNLKTLDGLICELENS